MHLLQTVAKLLGYTHMELKGKNINAIIPSPFAELHTGFIRQHVVHGERRVERSHSCFSWCAMLCSRPWLFLFGTGSSCAAGVSHLLGQNVHFVAVHKDRNKMLPCKVRVTKISGIGEDTCYLGYLEVRERPSLCTRCERLLSFAPGTSADAAAPMRAMQLTCAVQDAPMEPNTANVWLMMGSESVVAVDEAFTNVFGWRCGCELAGARLLCRMPFCATGDAGRA